MLDLVVLELLRVDAGLVDDGAVVLEHADTASAVAHQVAHRVHSDVAKALFSSVNKRL